MSIVVFCGPTLPPGPARARFPEVTFLEPAKCGDVYLACKRSPRAIGLIDGYFDHRLSVWHKEILWALSQGIPVFGAASMGALRAAELYPHGMVGVGVVFEQFRSGELEDDDEVAVLHEASERGYKACSDAMVNLRATLKVALSRGLLDSAGEAAFIAQAKATFYAERRFGAILQGTPQLSDTQKQGIQRWIETHGLIDQKRLDAIALLEKICAEEPSRTQLVPPFEQTHFWEVLQRATDRRTPEIPAEAQVAALERAVALLLGERSGAQVSPAETQAMSERIRRAHGLLTPESTGAWLAQNSLDVASFSALARDEVLVTRFLEAARTLGRAQAANTLRVLGSVIPKPDRKP
jgi:hypothetical protein